MYVYRAVCIVYVLMFVTQTNYFRQQLTISDDSKNRASVVQCTLYTVQRCTVYTDIQWIVYIVQCTVYIMQYVIYSVCRTVHISPVYSNYTIRYTVKCLINSSLYNVHCTVYSVSTVHCNIISYIICIT